MSILNKTVLMNIFFLGALIFFSSESTLGAEMFAYDCDPNRVLVKFKKLPPKAILRKFAIKYSLKFRRVIPKIGVYIFEIPSEKTARIMAKRVGTDARVEFAEPDFVRYAYYEPNDPLFQLQWDMATVGLPQFWDLEIGQKHVNTAVLDSGIDLDHPELINQLWVNFDEIPGNGVDDDNNGYVDDYNGYDFAGDGLFPLPGAEDPIPEDLYVGHGTHVSGTISAEQDNDMGMSGEAPGTKLMAVRVLGSIFGVGYSSDIAEGIVYAADNGASVINMSLGGSGKSMTEYLSLKYAWDLNVFIAAAAGNDAHSGNSISYPAAYVFAMSVGATDINDNIASFSTHNEFVEISAPGVDILSTVPGGTYESDWSGTSMATPHVAGLAALLYSAYPVIKNWQIRSMLQSGVVDLDTPGWDEFFGWGRADCEQLLATPLPSTVDLEIITPPDGIQFASNALVAILWNPVESAAKYRLTAELPNGGIWTKHTFNSYYTLPPYINVPPGSYVVKVEALDAGGVVISSDMVLFDRAS